MKKFTIGLILCIIFGLTGCQSELNKELKVQKSPTNIAIKDSIEIEKVSKEIERESIFKIEEFRQENQYYQVNMQIPVLEFNNKDIETRINEENRNEVMKSVTMLKELCNAMSEEELKNHSDMQKLYTGSEYRVTLENSEIISIKGMIFEFTGGAHGNSAYDNDNYNLNTGENIELENLFVENYDVEALVTNVVEKEIKDAPENYYEDILDILDINDNGGYYLVEEGIKICFNTYTLSHYAAGPQEILIEKEKLKDGLKPEYKKLWDK